MSKRCKPPPPVPLSQWALLEEPSEPQPGAFTVVSTAEATVPDTPPEWVLNVLARSSSFHAQYQQEPMPPLAPIEHVSKRTIYGMFSATRLPFKFETV